MQRVEFEELVDEALEGLPAWVAEAIDNLVVEVQDEPDERQRQYGRFLLGLYEGVNLHDRAGHYSGVMPDRIVIFRNNHLRLRKTRDELVQEVRKTVLHEVAHHLGIDDERLHELGY